MMKVFETQAFLEQYPDRQMRQDVCIYILDRLCKKVDVVQKVYTQYSEDLSCKKSSIEISKECYFILLKLYKDLCRNNLDFKLYKYRIEVKRFSFF